MSFHPFVPRTLIGVSRRYISGFRHSARVSPRKIFGQNLARLRLAAGLTQEKLCEGGDIDRSYLQRIENGTSSPTVEVAQRLKRALGCSWDALMQGLE